MRRSGATAAAPDAAFLTAARSDPRTTTETRRGCVPADLLTTMEPSINLPPHACNARMRRRRANPGFFPDAFFFMLSVHFRRDV